MNLQIVPVHKVIKNFSYLTISNLVQQIINFFCLVKITNLLIVKDLSSYLLITSIVNIFLVFSLLGLKQIIVREVAKNEKNTFNITFLSFGLILLATFISATLMYFYFSIFTNLSFEIILITTFLLFSISFWNLFEAIVFGKQLMHMSAIVGILFSVIWFFFIYFTPRSIIKDLSNILLIWAGINFFKLLALIIYIIKYKTIKINVDKDKLHFRQLLKYGFPLYISAILSLPISQFPIVFLSEHSTSIQVAFYGIGFKLFIPVATIFGNLFNSLFPKLSVEQSRDFNLFKEKSEKYFNFMTFCGIIISTVIYFILPEIIKFVFDEKYSGSFFSASLQLLLSINMMLHSFIGILLIAARKENLLLKLAFIGLFLVSIGNYFGSFAGAVGLAYTLFICMNLSLIIHIILIKKILNISLYKNNYVKFITYLLLGVSFFINLNFSLIVRLGIMFVVLLLTLYINRRDIIFLLKITHLENKWLRLIGIR